MHEHTHKISGQEFTHSHEGGDTPHSAVTHPESELAAKRFYAVRQFKSGKVLGSRIMTRQEAAAEVAAWLSAVGRAAMAEVTDKTRAVVRNEADQDALARLLNDSEPHVWISTTSHRSRENLRQVFRLAGDPYGPGLEYGSWPKGGEARGAYYRVNARHLPAIGRIKGVRVMAAEPRDLFEKWGQSKTGGPQS